MSTPAGVFVARISEDGSDLLAIDRDCEYRNSVTAAAAGAGPPVIEYRPQDRLLVIGYIEGRTLRPPDVAAKGNIARVAAACRRLPAGARRKDADPRDARLDGRQRLLRRRLAAA